MMEASFRYKMPRKSIIFESDKSYCCIMKVRLFMIGVLVLTCLGACKAKRDHVSSNPSIPDSSVEPVTLTPDRRPNKTEESTSSGEIYIAIDNALEPAIQAEINSFHGIYQEATIHPIYLPGEEAIARMIATDSIRLAIATRKLTKEEEDILESQYTFADYSEIGKEGIALLTHHDNPLDTLTQNQWEDMISGKIRSWEKISPGTDLGEIRLVFDNRRSGIIRFLRDSLLNGQSPKGDNFFALDSTQAVIDYVREHPTAIGMVGFSWISDWDDPEVRQRREGINLLAVGGVAKDSLCPYNIHAFKPYQTYLTTDCYPLLRSIYTIRREVSIGLGTGFIAYLAGPRGQRVLHKHGIAAIKGIPRQVKFPPKKGAREPESR
jgi:phosphate transport system substrate-binding protein